MLVAATVAAALLAACAVESTQPREPRPEAEYVTGSRLPKRDRSGVVSVSKEDIERAGNTNIERPAGSPQ